MQNVGFLMTLLIYVKIPTTAIVGILAFMSRMNFMLSLKDEHDKRFITSGPVASTTAQYSLRLKPLWQMKHYTNTPMQYTEIFHGCKNVNFQMKFFNIFLILLKTLIVGTH